MAKKILIFKVKKFCYDSPFYFADQMAKCFREIGWQVDVFDSDRQDMQELDNYSGRTYDAIIDFNSQLPALDTTENELYLDTINGPFYNYILDHPLYHHDMIKVALKNYHIICLDYNHKDYIDKWYPHIRSCHVVPIAGSAAKHPVPWQEKETDLIFTGTYTNTKYLLEMLHEMGGELEADNLELINRLNADRNLTLEEVFDNFASEIGIEKNLVRFPLRMHAYFPVDSYITALMREEAIRIIASSGQPITLVGHNWNKARFLKGLDNVTALPPVKFHQQFDLMANSKIVLNVMPWFKNGCHDRIYSTMLNGAVSLSDESKYLEDNFSAGESIVTYSLKKLESLPEMISSLLADDAMLKEIAENGQAICAKTHTWQAHCQILAEIFSANS